MLSCYLKCREKTYSKTPKVAKTSKGKLMVLSKCAVCDNKKPRFIKN